MVALLFVFTKNDGTNVSNAEAKESAHINDESSTVSNAAELQFVNTKNRDQTVPIARELPGKSYYRKRSQSRKQAETIAKRVSMFKSQAEELQAGQRLKMRAKRMKSISRN